MDRIRLTIVISFTALSIVTNYMLIGVPNVKFMDFIVFIGGFCFGPVTGALIGILTWLVYGTLNPYGFVFPIWITTMFSESLYGIFGGLLGRSHFPINSDERWLDMSLLFGVFGFILTFIYDLVTNVVTAFIFELPLLACIITGLPFTLLHELSNVIIFSIGSIPTLKVVRKVIGGDVEYLSSVTNGH